MSDPICAIFPIIKCRMGKARRVWIADIITDGYDRVTYSINIFNLKTILNELNKSINHRRNLNNVRL